MVITIKKITMAITLGKKRKKINYNYNPTHTLFLLITPKKKGGWGAYLKLPKKII
jgi:hypothetical protein